MSTNYMNPCGQRPQQAPTHGRGRASPMQTVHNAAVRGAPQPQHMHLHNQTQQAMANMYSQQAQQPKYLGAMNNYAHVTAPLAAGYPQPFYLMPTQPGAAGAQNGNTGVYYNPAPTQMPAQSQQQSGGRPASSMSSGMHMQTQHSQSGYQKPAPPPPARKKHVIAIVDPDTKATISEGQLAPQTEDTSDNMSTPTSSNRSTPSPPHSTTEHSQPVQVAAAQPTKSQPEMLELQQPTNTEQNPPSPKIITYTRECLMSLKTAQLSLAEPVGLGNNALQEIMSSGKSMPNSPRNSMSKRSSVSHSRPSPIVVTYRREEVKLQKAENMWKPGDKASANQSEEEEAHSDLLMKFRRLLNKLTPSTFQAVLERLLQLPVRTEKDLSEVVRLVFDKARNEPEFSKIYATLCQAIAKEYKVKSQVTGEEVNFRKLLLIRCQKEFEMLAQDDSLMLEKMQNLEKALENAQSFQEEVCLNEEFQTFQTKARHRKLSCMRFLGELFLLQMLTVRIMHECMTCLLKAADEESLEYLCQLWTTIGKVLDTKEKAKTYNDQYFTQMQEIATGEIRNVSVRIRSALQDVIELRENNWIPRRDEIVPKTLEEIRKEMAMEAAEKQVMIDKGIPTRNSQGRAPQAPSYKRRPQAGERELDC